MTRRTQGRHRATDCISQVCPGNGETCRMRFDSPMTQARRILARNRVTDCVFQDLPGFQKSPNQKRWTWRYIVGCRKESSRVHRRHLDTTSSIIRMPKLRECSQKKMRTYVGYGRQACFELGDEGGRNPQDHSPRSNFENNFPVNTATWCIFARDCLRGCQNYFFSNTQDILDILTGSLLENEQYGEPVIFARRRQIFSRRPDRW